jgi:CheY-like chemotaxis protein
VLALTVHELMTNAAKYGALSTPTGELEITWSLTDAGDCEVLWVESDGPEVAPPIRQGFGSKLVQTTMVYDLGGRADVDYDPKGMKARLLLPAKHVTVGAETDTPTIKSAEPGSTGTLSGKALLLVEDQSLIALDTEELLRRLGAREVRLSPDATHAVLTLGSFRSDVAVLDFNLGEETSERVADHLVAMGVPFIFSTGYGDSVMIPERFRDVPVVRKPASAASLISHLGQAQTALGS